MRSALFSLVQPRQCRAITENLVYSLPGGCERDYGDKTLMLANAYREGGFYGIA